MKFQSKVCLHFNPAIIIPGYLQETNIINPKYSLTFEEKDHRKVRIGTSKSQLMKQH